MRCLEHCPELIVRFQRQMLMPAKEEIPMQGMQPIYIFLPRIDDQWPKLVLQNQQVPEPNQWVDKKHEAKLLRFLPKFQVKLNK